MCGGVGPPDGAAAIQGLISLFQRADRELRHMSYFGTVQSARSAARLIGHTERERPDAMAANDAEQPALWTPARIDLARRLWCKGMNEADILVAINKLPGAVQPNGQAIAALARRLCWPRPERSGLCAVPTTRDGSPSIAERQAAELARAQEFVELPMAEAAAWGRANGIPRMDAEPDAALLLRINRARTQWRLPRFSVTRFELTESLLPPRRRPAPGYAVRRM
jgi:hypothetical protein